MEKYGWYWYTNFNKGIDMKLTTSEIQLVKRTFEMVTPLADTFALIFYDRLFYLSPQVRPLFITDMSVQRQKLMNMMILVVRGLDQPEFFIEELRQMGLRHASYRVEPDNYLIMIEAVVWALNECLGEQLTEEMYSAWKNTLTLVSDIMLEGASSTA
jgi:nitric oxide dioxygenase